MSEKVSQNVVKGVLEPRDAQQANSGQGLVDEEFLAHIENVEIGYTVRVDGRISSYSEGKYEEILEEVIKDILSKIKNSVKEIEDINITVKEDVYYKYNGKLEKRYGVKKEFIIEMKVYTSDTNIFQQLKRSGPAKSAFGFIEYKLSDVHKNGNYIITQSGGFLH